MIGHPGYLGMPGMGGQPLDFYLDGLLDEAERATFERSLEREPALRLAFQASRALDGAIRRIVTPPSESKLRSLALAAIEREMGSGLISATQPTEPLGHAEEMGSGLISATQPTEPLGHAGNESRPHFLQAAPRSEGARHHLSSHSGPWLAIAAALLLLATAWALWPLFRPGPPDPYALQPHRTMEQVYRDVVGEGFEPPVVCRTGREFEAWFRMRLGQGLALTDPLPAGVSLLGIGYCHTISRSTIFVMARVDGEPVLVFVDRVKGGAIEGPDEGSGLHMTRQTVGELVVCEVSPLAEPRVLELLHEPE